MDPPFLSLTAVEAQPLCNILRPMKTTTSTPVVLISVPTLLAIVDHFVIGILDVSKPLILGALLGNTDGDGVHHITSSYGIYHRAELHLEKNTAYEQELYDVLHATSGEEKYIGWYSWNLTDEISVEDISDYYAQKTHGMPVLHLAFQDEKPLTAMFISPEYPCPKPVTVEMNPLPADPVSQEQACYTVQRLIHRLDSVIGQRKDQPLSPFFGNLISFLRGIGRPNHVPEDIFSDSISWMDPLWINENLGNILYCLPDGSLGELGLQHPLNPPNADIVAAAGSVNASHDADGPWDFLLRFGSIYFEANFSGNDVTPHSLKSRTIYIMQVILRLIPEWVIRMMRFSSSDTCPTHISFHTGRDNACRFRFITGPLAEIKPWHPVTIEELSLVGHRRIWGGRPTITTCDFNGTPAIVKSIVWRAYRKYANRETEVYRLIDGQGIGPQFLGHMKRNGRVVGNILEKVRGRHPLASDVPACLELLDRLHRLGLSHGDVHPGNFIISESGPVMIDFESSKAWKEEEPEDITRLINVDYDNTNVELLEDH